MARRSVGEINTRVTANTSDFMSKMGLVNRQLNSSRRQFQISARAVIAFGSAITAIVTSGVIARMTRQGLENVDSIAKQADMLNMSTESLVGFERQASRSGMTVEAFRKNMERMQVSIAQAQQGLGTAKRGFEALGLSAQQLAEMEGEKQLIAVARAMERVESQTKRTGIAYDIFGQRGVRMLKIMEEGADAMEAANLRAEQLGITFSRIDAARVERANDALDEMRMLFNALRNQMAIGIAPLLEELAQGTADWAVEMGGMAQVSERIITALVTGAGFVIDAWNRVQGGWKVATGVISGLIFSIASDFMQLAEVSIRAWDRLMHFVTTGWTLLRADAGIAIRGIEIFFREMISNASVAMLSFSAETVQGLNAIIRGMNAISGSEIEPISLRGMQRQAERLVEGLEQARAVRDDLISERDLVSTDFEEREMSQRFENMQRVFEQASRKSADLVAEGFEQAGSKVGSEMIDAFERIMRRMPEVTDSAEQETEEIGRWFDRLAPHVDGFAMALEDSLLRAAENGKFAIGDLARYVLAEINRMIIRTMVLRSLFGGLGNIFSGTELGDAFTGAAERFGGARARGGPVTAGQAYLVGEKGPELMVPSRSGSIVSNDKITSGKGAGQEVYIDARGADQAAIARLENQLRSLNASVDTRAAIAVQQQFQRRPAFGMR